jgi:hypothetical protein
MTINCPKKLKAHDEQCAELFPIFEELGIPYRTPNEYETANHDNDNDDHGFDLVINGHFIDFKNFGLRLINNSATWDSPHWDRRHNPHRPGLINEYYIFRTSPNPREWLAMRRSDVKLSKHGYAPYCWKNELLTLGQLIDIVTTL